MGTYKLDGGHVLLPPQVFLEARSCSRESVVEVHDNVDACIHQGVEGAHSPYFRREKKTHRIVSNSCTVIALIYCLTLKCLWMQYSLFLMHNVSMYEVFCIDNTLCEPHQESR